jgi:hypothetical protein
MSFFMCRKTGEQGAVFGLSGFVFYAPTANFEYFSVPDYRTLMLTMES